MMIRSFTLSAIATLLLSCGGSAAPGPTTLQWRYDEVYIAQLSLEEKATVLKAQNEYQRARAQQMKAEADLNENNTKLQISQNEQKQGLLSEKSANQEKSAAESSGDMNRINLAAKASRIAVLARRASDEKISYLRAQRDYLKKYLRYCQEETYHREARYEHEKARLGKANNIAPKGVQYDKFQGQTADRSRRSQIAKQRAKQLAKKAEAAKKNWKKRLAEVDQARGVPAKVTPSKAAGPLPALPPATETKEAPRSETAKPTPVGPSWATPSGDSK